MAGTVPHRTSLSSERSLAGLLRHGAAFILLASSGVVLFEPAPYDILALVFMALLVATGLPINGRIAPLVLPLVTIIGSAYIAATQAVRASDPYLYVTITSFLAITAVAFALYVSTDTSRAVRLLMAGYVAAAASAALIAVAAYFHLIPGSELFLLFGRAKGTFEDPNVFGPFLVPPALFLMRRILTGGPHRHPLALALLIVILVGLFLSFSRGAWGYLVIAALILIFLTFVSAGSTVVRLKLLVVSTVVLFSALAVVVFLVSLPDVQDLFLERARLTQTYDTDEGGRFSRYIDGTLLVMSHPLGLGPREFGFLFTEAPHNVYLKMFSAYGWAAGAAFLVLMSATLIFGARQLFAYTPWQSTYQVVYASFLGLLVLALVIDIDRWRHFYLLIGMLWGMMISTDRAAVHSKSDRSRGLVSQQTSLRPRVA